MSRDFFYDLESNSFKYLQDFGQEDQILPLSWKIVNDSLRTDIALLYPPYQVALGEAPFQVFWHHSILTGTGKFFARITAAMQMAMCVLQKDGKSWFAEISVDMDKIQEITRYILALYELYKTYDEKKEIQALLQKMPKPKSQPSR